MPQQRIHATWLFSSPDAVDLERRLLANPTGADVIFVQESDGAGALAIGNSDPATSLRNADGERRHGVFDLRTVYPADAQTAIEDTPHLLAVRLFVPAADRDEVRRWLDEEHCAFQLRVPGTNWYLGYEQIGDEHSFLNLWALDNPAVVESAEWAEARDTEWRSRLLQSFERQDRAVYRPLHAGVHGAQEQS